MIWSSDSNLIGRHFGANDELEEALAGELVIHGDSHDHHENAPSKDEHVNLDTKVNYFVEIYIPIRDTPRGRVIGVVELYKNPIALAEALETGRTFTFIGAAVAGLFLYLTLFGLSRRADGVIRAQQERLVQSETLAAVGEMGSAVAHGIRGQLRAVSWRDHGRTDLQGDVGEGSRERARVSGHACRNVRDSTRRAR